MKFVVMFAVAAITARGALMILGAAIPGREVAHRQPSPDMIGVDGPISKNDLSEADAVLGLTEADFRGAA
jgi:hypothetical protein